MKLTGAQAIVRSLEYEKVNIIFGYPGAAICPFYNALLDSDIKHILTRHEQGAAHAASGYARATGKTGVCIATSGPGATNLITGIATAYMDSIPLIAITGQVSSEMIGKDVFQEADITGATAPFCKHSYLVKKAGDLPGILKDAFYIASSGRPGPVLIDIPIDIQNDEIEFEYPNEVEIRGYKPKYKGHPMQIKRVAEAIEKATAPVICAGGGVISSGASDVLMKLAEKCSIPVTTTLMGKGVIPFEHKLNMGMLGSHGTYMANYAVHHSDLLIIIGARVADRAMGKPYKIAKKAKIVHIDIDPAEIGKNVGAAIPIVGNAEDILEDLLEIIMDESFGDVSFDKWNQTIAELKVQHPLRAEYEASGEYVNPKLLLKLLSDMAEDDTIITTEVGQNQIWAANHFGTKKPGTFISSGGMGTMGYGLPSAVGAKVGKPEKVVIAISGDGSFQMSMQELGTIKQYKLGLKIIILNNSRLGMVRELQRINYCSRYSQVYLEDNPDFVKLVGAYGIKGERITNNSQIGAALGRMLSDEESYLIECKVDPDESTL